MRRKRQAVFLCVCMHGGRREGGQVCLNMDSHILDFPKWVRTYSTSHSQRTSNAYPQGMAVHCCWWLMRWTSNFTPRRWNHWNEDMKALAKADTFFFFLKTLASNLSQEQKSVFSDRKFISPTKPIFPLPAFHSDKPYKINVFSNSPAVRKIKAWKLHKYILLIIVAGIFFLFGKPSIQIKL